MTSGVSSSRTIFCEVGRVPSDLRTKRRARTSPCQHHRPAPTKLRLSPLSASTSAFLVVFRTEPHLLLARVVQKAVTKNPNGSQHDQHYDNRDHRVSFEESSYLPHVGNFHIHKCGEVASSMRWVVSDRSECKRLVMSAAINIQNP